MTKEILLSYKGFVDNSYLDEYVSFINSKLNRQVLPDVVYQKHHVIPVCWYSIGSNQVCKNKKLKQASIRSIANKDCNQELVMLTKEEHFHAHELLENCSTGRLYNKLSYARERMYEKLNRPKKETKCKEQQLVEHKTKKVKHKSKQVEITSTDINNLKLEQYASTRTKKHAATSFSLKTILRQEKVVIKELVRLYHLIDAKADTEKSLKKAQRIINKYVKIPR